MQPYKNKKNKIYLNYSNSRYLLLYKKIFNKFSKKFKKYNFLKKQNIYYFYFKNNIKKKNYLYFMFINNNNLKLKEYLYNQNIDNIVFLNINYFIDNNNKVYLNKSNKYLNTIVYKNNNNNNNIVYNNIIYNYIYKNFNKIKPLVIDNLIIEDKYNLLVILLKFFFPNKNFFIKVDGFYKKNPYFFFFFKYIYYILINKKIKLFFFKDLNIFYNMIIGWKLLDKTLLINNFNISFNKNHFKVHPIIGATIRNFFLKINYLINNQYYGISVKIAGKFGLGGSVRKRKFFFNIGFNTNRSNPKNNSIITKKQIWTHTGVLGTTILFSSFSI